MKKLCFGLFYLLLVQFHCGYSDFQSGANPRVTDLVFLQISIGDYFGIGSITIGVFGEVCPKTVHNFKELAKRPFGMGYKGSQFHEVIPDFVIVGGDYTTRDGARGHSIYGQYFPDENYELEHYGAGWVSMDNMGTDTNGSKFMISLNSTDLLDRHVVFGKVLKGMRIVRLIERMPTKKSRPIHVVIISNSGFIPIGNPFEVTRTSANENT